MDWTVKSVEDLLMDWRQIYLLCIDRSSLPATPQYLEASPLVKPYGMDNDYKRDVRQSLLDGTIFAIYDGKNTLNLTGFGKSTGKAYTEAKQNFEPVLDNRQHSPNFLRLSQALTNGWSWGSAMETSTSSWWACSIRSIWLVAEPISKRSQWPLTIAQNSKWIRLVNSWGSARGITSPPWFIQSRSAQLSLIPDAGFTSGFTTSLTRESRSASETFSIFPNKKKSWFTMRIMLLTAMQANRGQLDSTHSAPSPPASDACRGHFPLTASKYKDWKWTMQKR